MKIPFSVEHRKALLIAALIMAVVAAVAVSWWRSRLKEDGGQESAVAADVVTLSVNDPVEEVPKEPEYVWKGGESDPKKISLPVIGVDGFIQKVGVDQRGEIAVPNNIHIAGWFVNTVRPGESGLSIIDGHVNGPTSDTAIFTELPKLKKGDEFSVERGDGTKLAYKVIETGSYKVEEAASYLFSQSPRVLSQLNLITCAGNYDRTARTYSERVIVQAELLPAS